jgi:hydroxyacylglutathione hydrolase
VARGRASGRNRLNHLLERDVYFRQILHEEHFVGDVGRVDLALEEIDTDAVRERAGTLYDSVQRILQLPEWTELYPGHYAGSVCGRGIDGKPVSTVGRERRKSRALQLSRADFLIYQTTDLPPLPADFHAIKRSNLGL